MQEIKGDLQVDRFLTAVGGFKDTYVTTAISLGDSLNTAFLTSNKTIVGSANELYNYVPYAGLLAQPTITDNGNGTITVGTAQAVLYATTDFSGKTKTYTIPSATLTPTDGVASTLAVNYNGGSPIYTIEIQGSLNWSSVTPVQTINRTGNEIYMLNWDSISAGMPEKTVLRLVKTERFARESGIMLSEAGIRNITITSGVAWNGITRYSLNAANSSTDVTEFWYHVAGVWTMSLVTTYNNTQYDNGTNLQTLGGGKYTVNWIYRRENTIAEIFYVLGSGNYKLSDATSSQPPASLPDVIRTDGILVGRIIVVQGGSTATEIDSAFDVSFGPASVRNHNDLAGLQGGTASEYYHLTSAQWTIATQAATSLVSGYLTSTDWSTFNGKQDSYTNQGTTTTVLHGNASGVPTFGSIVEADMSLSNNATNDATTLRHGFLPILSGNTSQYLRADGAYATPSGVTSSYTSQTFTSKTTVVVTHGFGAYPVVQIINNSGAVIIPLSIVNNSTSQFTVTFSVSTSGTIIASVGSPQPASIVSVSGNYTTLTTDQTIKVTAQAVTITVMTAIGNGGKIQNIKNYSTGNILVNTTLSQTIDRQLLWTLPALSNMAIQSDGANWICL